jgi:hypothetical protein
VNPSFPKKRQKKGATFFFSLSKKKEKHKKFLFLFLEWRRFFAPGPHGGKNNVEYLFMHKKYTKKNTKNFFPITHHQVCHNPFFS